MSEEMGGHGSGTWYRFDKHTTTDETHSLDIRQWYRKGLLRPGYSFSTTWSRGDRQTGSITTLVLSRNLVVLVYRVRAGSEWQDVQEQVLVEWTPCNFGGERPWFWCPGVVNGQTCRRRVAVLYGPGRYFACRHCYDLRYESQREADYSRALRRAQTIRRRLGGSESMIHPFPEKPKRMRWQTYDRLLSKHDRADRASWLGIKAWLEQIDNRQARSARR